MASTVIPERMRERLTALSMSQAALARSIGVAQPTIAKLVTGGSGGSKHLHRIARVLETTPDYLTGVTDDPDPGALPVPTAGEIADQLDVVGIPELDLQLGMGAAFLDRAAAPVAVRYFPAAMLRGLTDADPANLVVARGDGDSMAPTIQDRDLVLIDISRRLIDRQDRIWALAYGELGTIKRVRVLPDGGYRLMSDNQAVESEVVVPDEVAVIGRVVAAVRRM